MGHRADRAGANHTLELPDPERRISRRQAEASAIGAGFTITDVDSASSSIAREPSLSLGESAPLAWGDQLRVGAYVLEVTIDGAIADDRTTIDPGDAGLDPFAPVPASAPALAKAGSLAPTRAVASSPPPPVRRSCPASVSSPFGPSC